jgi:hypothetical protein
MSPVPLEELGWSWQDHKSALWWLGLLYRCPDQFPQSLAGVSRSQEIFTVIRLWVHFLPYLVGICVLGRLFAIGALGLSLSRPFGGLSDALYLHAMGVAVGIVVGIVGGIAGGSAVGIAVGIAILRSYYYPIHVAFVWPRIRPEWYPYHPVAWDNLCAIPFFKLDHLLVAYAERIPEHGMAEIKRLIDSYPSQRPAALRARVRLLARESARMTDLSRLHALMAQLPEGERGFLSQTPQVREMVREITELQLQLDTINRPILREPIARLLATRLWPFRNRPPQIRSGRGGAVQ